MRKVYLFVATLKKAPQRKRTSGGSASGRRNRFLKPIGFKKISLVMALFISAFVLGDKLGDLLSSYLVIIHPPKVVEPVGVGTEPSVPAPVAHDDNA